MRYYIRDLLWAAVLVAVGMGWLLDHQKGLKREEALERRIRELQITIKGGY